MPTIATRPETDVTDSLESIAALPTVAEAHTDRRATGDDWERIAVVVLGNGIECIPPGVCRAIGDADFGIDSIEEYPDGHREVVLR